MVCRIIVVEDSPMDLAYVSKLLSKLGYQHDSIDDGFEAAVQIKKSTILYDLVLLDINLPMIDGISLLGDIRANKPNLPVIVLSGTCDEDEISQVKQLGASDFISKPATLEILDKAIKKALKVS
jgi:DNA-binding response OmpR family regulator